jgi:hypothetical protein
MKFIINPVTAEQSETKALYLEANQELFAAISEHSKRNSFLARMAAYVAKGWILSPAQLAASQSVVNNITLRTLQSQGEVTTPVKAANPDASVAVGDIITVNHMMAVKIGLQAGFEKKFHNVEVLEVISENYSSVTARVVTSYKRVCHCGICGLKLTDENSIALGIGPVCAKAKKIKRVEDLNVALGKAEMTIRIPRFAIKNIFKFNVAEGKAA